MNVIATGPYEVNCVGAGVLGSQVVSGANALGLESVVGHHIAGRRIGGPSACNGVVIVCDTRLKQQDVQSLEVDSHCR